MTSARRRSEPIESVKLEVSLRTDKKTADRVKEAFPEARIRAGRCELTLEGREPSELAEKMKILAERLRGAERL
jgi:hypothetical protein